MLVYVMYTYMVINIVKVSVVLIVPATFIIIA